jgi:hypothetical protein
MRGVDERTPTPITMPMFTKEALMGTRSVIRVDTGSGIFWVIGWMFTIAFAKLIWWQALLGLFVWPYYLGLAALAAH